MDVFLQQKTGFYPKAVHLGFTRNEVALQQVYLRVIRISSVSCHSIAALYSHSFIHSFFYHWRYVVYIINVTKQAASVV